MSTSIITIEARTSASRLADLIRQAAEDLRRAPGGEILPAVSDGASVTIVGDPLLASCVVGLLAERHIPTSTFRTVA